MSKIALEGNASGTGTFTIASPNSNNNRTLTLPDNTGTVLTTGAIVTEAQGGTGTTTGYYGFKNRIINGAMVIDQRNAGASVTVNTTNVYTLDRWALSESSDAVFTVQQDSSAPSGFNNSAKVTVTTADASIGTAQYNSFQQRIEGFNFADMAWGTANAQPVTLSFWVRSSVTGTFGGAIANSAYNRSYPFTYAINAANTWEQKSITITGDTSGTWLTTNGIGITLYFDLGSGVDNTGTANAWVGAGNVGADSTVQLANTLNATWYITGVQLEKGSTATSFDYRPYGTELGLCQRYFTNWVGDSSGTGFRAIGSGYVPNVATDLTVLIPLSVSMRTTPTLSYSGTISGISGNTIGTVSSIQTTYASSNQSVWAIFRTGATFTTGYAGIVYTQNASTNFVSASAEL